MAKDLLYRPSLKYDKNYYTEGNIKDTSTTENISDTNVFEKKEVIDNLIAKTESKFKFLSDEIKKTYLPPFAVMKDEYKKIEEEYIDNDTIYTDPINHDPTDPDPIKTISIVAPDIEDYPDKDISSIFDREDDIYVDITDPMSNPVEIIKRTYYVNFLDIYEDYLLKMDASLTKYIMSTMQALSLITTKRKLSDYSTTNLKNKDLLHLSDFLIKSDVNLSQTMRLHKKLFNLDEIILHIRSIRITKEQMIRYNNIPEQTQVNFLDVDSNIILKESIRVSEKKYENNLYSLYKHLNSSVILLDESLKTLTKQNKAMIIISNKNEKEND